MEFIIESEIKIAHELSWAPQPSQSFLVVCIYSSFFNYFPRSEFGKRLASYICQFLIIVWADIIIVF